MKERGIIMSTPMVRALVAGRKTQTRRIVQWPPWAGDLQASARAINETGGIALFKDGLPRKTFACPYGAPGDVLYVRETWAPTDPGAKVLWSAPDAEKRVPGGVVYKADVPEGLLPLTGRRWHPAIHMPKAHARIRLKLTGVSVERLQAITEADALAEGVSCVPFIPADGFPICDGFMAGPDDGKSPLEPKAVVAYKHLWDDINGDRAPWDSKPWVWVLVFEVLPIYKRA